MATVYLAEHSKHLRPLQSITDSDGLTDMNGHPENLNAYKS
jgi:hypothetical protein